MTVNELLKELDYCKDVGLGDKPVMLMNLNTQENEEAEKINILNDDWWEEENRAVEIR